MIYDQAGRESGSRGGLGGPSGRARPADARRPGLRGRAGGRSRLLGGTKRRPDGPGQPGAARLARQRRLPAVRAGAGNRAAAAAVGLAAPPVARPRPGGQRVDTATVAEAKPGGDVQDVVPAGGPWTASSSPVMEGMMKDHRADGQEVSDMPAKRRRPRWNNVEKVVKLLVSLAVGIAELINAIHGIHGIH